MKELSLVIPVYNEEGNIKELHDEIKAVCESNNYKYEIVIVDDGSTDRTQEISMALSPVKYIRFRRNFGQTAAMDAGISNAIYPYIVTMDGDRQNDPKDIPKMIEYLEENDLDVVSGWRKKRRDLFIKKITSRGAYFIRRLLINDGIHDSGCSLKIYKKECFEQISLYGEMHRFIPALLKIKGFSVGEIVVNHRPRTKGKTKYNWRRMVKGFIDMISVWFWNKYAVRPLHLLGGLGGISIFLGIISIFITIYIFFKDQDLSNTVWPLLSAFFLLTGIQLFVSGLLADILFKDYYETTKDCSYNIKVKIENR